MSRPRYIRNCLLLLVSFVCARSFAAPAGPADSSGYIFKSNGKFTVPYEYFSYLKDTTGGYKVDDVRAAPIDGQFIPFTSPLRVCGFTRYPYWVRFRADNPTDKAIEGCLQFNEANIDELTFYHFRPDTVVVCSTGIRYPFHRRDIDDRLFIFNCTFPPHGSSEIYLYCRSIMSLELPVSMCDRASFVSERQTFHFTTGIIYGILLFFGFAALYLSLIHRNTDYCFFALFLLLFCMLLASLDGLTYKYLWPASPRMQYLMVSFFTSVSLAFSILFSIRFLKIDSMFPRMAAWGNWIIGSWAASFLFALIIKLQAVAFILNILILVTILFLSVIAIVTFRKYDRITRFIVLSWMIFMLFVAERTIIYSFAVNKLPLYTYFLHTAYSRHFGIVLMAISILIAIGHRMRQIEHERNTALLESSALQRKALELQLSNLQTRVQPHFLFNILNTIANMSVVDPQRVENALIELSDFYRTILNYASRNVVRLDEEMSIVKRYLCLEKMRFGNRLEFSIEVDEVTKNVKLPAMSIQILTENSLKHGIHHKIEGGSIHISIKRQFDKCRIAVDDTGVGLSNKAGGGTGLSNLRSRLDLIFHGDYSLDIIDKATACRSEETGVATVLTIPFHSDVPIDKKTRIFI